MHDVQTDQRAGAAQTCATVHCHGLAAARVALSQRNEVANDVVLGARAVGEFHFVNLDGVASEAASVVETVIQPDDALHVHVEELVDEVIWACVVADSHVARVAWVLRRRERDDLIRNDPAEITLLQHRLELPAIEASVAVPSELDSALDTLQTVQNGQWEVVRAHSCISEVAQAVQVRGSESSLNLLDRIVLANDEV